MELIRSKMGSFYQNYFIAFVRYESLIHVPQYAPFRRFFISHVNF